MKRPGLAGLLDELLSLARENYRLRQICSVDDGQIHFGQALGLWVAAAHVARRMGIEMPDPDALEHEALDNRQQPIRYIHMHCARCGTKAVAA